jgi:small-conductance mechanosensitive channel
LQEEKEALWSVAVGLFDPYNLGRISEDFCTEAVVTIYKEQRFTAASINDFGELHQSLRLGIDIVYWIIMLFVLQSIFGFDLTTYLLPFITLLLTVSFAIAPLVGNIFLAFAFVFFMAPYDIGNKVQFGLYNLYTPPVIGYIKSVTLLYTVVTTTRNETVRTSCCASLSAP